MGNTVEKYINYINRGGINKTITTMLIKEILDSECDIGAIKCFASKFNEECERNTYWLNTQNDVFGEFNGIEKIGGGSYNTFILNESRSLLVYSYIGRIADTNIYNFPLLCSNLKYVDTKKRLLLHTINGNYVLGSNGVYKMDRFNNNIYTYYQCDKDGEVVKESVVLRDKGLVKENSLDTDYIDSLSNIGRFRKNNEDRVLAVKHKLSDEFKLLAVADGVGGMAKGEYASSYTINSLYNWFNNLSLDDFNSLSGLNFKLKHKIKDINKHIYYYGIDNNCRLGTTLTCALVGKKMTTIVNVGDSRCYALSNKELRQLTDDDSLAYYLYKKGAMTKDEIRYYCRNNIISQSLGSEDINLSMQVIPNSSYDTLLLLTDGVTDCLSDSKIKMIANTANKDNILSNLIDEAVNKEQKIEPIVNLSNEEIHIPKAGKDNASGAILVKKIGK